MGADVYIDENICKPFRIGKHVTYHHDPHQTKGVDLHEDVPLEGNRLPDDLLYVLKYCSSETVILLFASAGAEL